MNFNVLNSFFSQCINGFNNAWYPSDFAPLSNIQAPDLVFSGDDSIKTDVLLRWASWFFQSMCLIDSFDELSKPQIISRVRDGISCFGVSLSQPDKDKISILIANFLYNQSKNSLERKRQKLTERKRQEIIAVKSGVNKVVSCWVCGHRFDDDVVQRFLISRKVKPALPDFVDVLTPRGLVDRDLDIEVEHKIPFSKGGGDLDDINNIDISCGWCNKGKSNYLSIYDANSKPKIYFNKDVNFKISVPQPYWAIRKLAYNNKCSHPNCVNENGLRISLINLKGAATPLNIKVVCKEHDDLRDIRLVPRLNYKSCIIKHPGNYW